MVWRKKQLAKTGPANLAAGRAAYPVVFNERGMGVEFPFGWMRIEECRNGMYVEGSNLYGWCGNDARAWKTQAITSKCQAKWALFRKIEVKDA